MIAVPDWLRPLYPFATRAFQTELGARMNYVDEPAAGTRADGVGQGSAVLLVHGNPTWSFYYRHVIAALSAAGRRCIAPDHIGMGLSDKPADYPYTLERRITDLADLVASLGLRQLDLVVHDWGGAIGFGLAARRPDLVRRIVILNTAAFPSDRIPARIALCKTRFPGTALVRGLNGFAWPATWMSMHRRALTSLEKRAYLLPHGTWADRVAVDAFVKDIPLRAGHPTRPVLEAVAAGIERFRDREVLIAWGARDFCFTTHFYDEWRRRLPQAQTHLLEDVGHYIADDAREQVAPLVAKFLAG